MKRLLVATAVAMTGVAAQADILTLTYGADAKVISTVKIADSATLNIDGRNTGLTAANAGLRKKQVAVFWPEIYVGELLTAGPLAQNCTPDHKKVDDTSLQSLKNQKAVAVRMNFVHDLTKEQVDTAFRDALNANKVDLADAGVKAFLDFVKAQGDVDSGTTLTIVGEPGAEEDIITVQDVNGAVKTDIKGTDLVTKIFAIWLGEPAKNDEGARILINALACGQ